MIDFTQRSLFNSVRWIHCVGINDGLNRKMCFTCSDWSVHVRLQDDRKSAKRAILVCLRGHITVFKDLICHCELELIP